MKWMDRKNPEFQQSEKKKKCMSVRYKYGSNIINNLDYNIRYAFKRSLIWNEVFPENFLNSLFEMKNIFLYCHHIFLF